MWDAKYNIRPTHFSKFAFIAFIGNSSELYFDALFLGAANMVKWGIPERTSKMQFRSVGLRSIGPPDEKLGQIQISA